MTNYVASTAIPSPLTFGATPYTTPIASSYGSYGSFGLPAVSSYSTTAGCPYPSAGCPYPSAGYSYPSAGYSYPPVTGVTPASIAAGVPSPYVIPPNTPQGYANPLGMTPNYRRDLAVTQDLYDHAYFRAAYWSTAVGPTTANIMFRKPSHYPQYSYQKWKLHDHEVHEHVGVRTLGNGSLWKPWGLRPSRVFISEGNVQ
jgi:hypothetical protein